MSYNFKVYDLGNNEIHVCSFPNYVQSGSVNYNDYADFQRSLETLKKCNKHGSCSVSSYENLSQDKKDLFNQLRSVRRSKDSIYKLALCNEWDYFTTFTFDSSNYRYDYDVCIKRFRQWVSNLKKRFCPNLQYLFIVEPHKDGAYHLHGLMSGVDPSLLDQIKSDVYVFRNYNFGICDVQPVKDSAKISNYITKYITKELFFKGSNKHNYFCSRGLKHPEVKTFNLPETRIEDFFLSNFPDYEINHIYNGKNHTCYLSCKKKDPE